MRKTEPGRPGPGRPKSSDASAPERPARNPRPRRPRPPRDDTGAGKSGDRMRIAKAIAQAGLCSRRDAERWIEAGRVAVNGDKITSPALDIGPADQVTVDGKPLPSRAPTQLWRYHKPRGLVTTHRDPQGRPTVFDNLPADLPRVVSIGRLDVNTEGLLLLTNDGELARHLELPSTGWLRRYRVRVHGTVTQAQLDGLSDGIVVEGVRYGPIEATLDSEKGANRWLTIGIREGKNREVRKVLAALDLTVNRLIRVSYGPFQLLDLEPGKTEPVRRRVLVDQLGASVAKAFNLSAEAALAAEAGKQTHRIDAARANEARRPPRKPRAARPDPGTADKPTRKSPGRRPDDRPDGRSASRPGHARGKPRETGRRK